MISHADINLVIYVLTALKGHFNASTPSYRHSRVLANITGLERSLQQVEVQVDHGIHYS